MKIQSIRGTHDIYGEDIHKFNKIKSEISFLSDLFNFKEIQTPIMESTELFAKPLGEHSDVVLKEMYTFLDRNNDSLTLRPEYTTPMIRAAISNNLLSKLPCKLFGIGQMFRRERPQKGRYRQFNQINFEILGTNDTQADIELILIANKFLNSLIPEVKLNLEINSLGDRKTLFKYKDVLSDYLKKNKTKLSKYSKTKILTNPLRVLDSKESEDKKIIENAPKINDFLSNDALLNYNEVKNSLENLNIDYRENPSLVRGLDYYCHTVFEFKTEALGSQDTLIGGGRYNGLVEVLGGPDIPGVGWAGGIERMILLMQNQQNEKKSVHLAILEHKFKYHALKVYKLLLDNNIAVDWNYKFNLKKSLSHASEAKAKYIIIIGEEEIKKNKFTIKNLTVGKQQIVDFENIINIINNG